MRNRTIILLWLFSLLSVIAQTKVVDKSGKKPEWVDGMKDGYVIGSATANTIEQAKEQAFTKVKAIVSASVAEHINTTTELSKEEVRADNLSSMYSKYSSITQSQTGKRDFLYGISPNKVKGFYWERRRERKTKREQVTYSILYPFSNIELMELVDEFKEKDAELTREMKKCLKLLDDYTAVEHITQSIAQLKKLKEIFIDERKTKCEVGIEKGGSLLQSIYIMDQGSSLGEALYSLKIGDKVVSTARRPKLASKCASISKKEFGQAINRIVYDVENCYDDPNNSIVVTYRIAGKNVSKAFSFDQSASQVKINVNGLIRVKDGKLSVPIISETAASFTVTRLLFDFQDGTSIDVKINQEFSGEGQKAIEQELEQQCGVSKTVNGHIYYVNNASGESESIRIYKQAIKVE